MLKVGIIGNGGIANCHASGYKALGDRVEIVACCDIVEEKAKAFAEKYDIPNYYTDCKDMLAKEDIDVISVCTWNSAHAPCTIAALDAGCHVICEKPMAMSAAEAEEMKAAAEKNGKLLMVGFVRRQGDDARDAKALVDNGELGEVYYAKATYLRRCGYPGGWFGNKELSGGGPLIDLGVHLIDLSIWLMGNPTPVSVSGNTFSKFSDNDLSDSANSDFGDKKAEGIFDVEDLAMGMIRFDNGAILQIEFSWASNIKGESRFVELRGSKAGLTWKDGKLEIYTEEEGELVDIIPTKLSEKDGHGRNLKHFYDVVIDGAKPDFEPQQGIDMIKILCAMYESAKQGKEIAL